MSTSPDTGPVTGATRPLWGPVRTAGQAEPVSAPPLGPPLGPPAVPGPVVPAPRDGGWGAPPRPVFPPPPGQGAPPTVVSVPLPRAPVGPPVGIPRNGGPGPARRSTPLLVALAAAAVVVAVVGGVVAFGRTTTPPAATTTATPAAPVPAAAPKRSTPTAAAPSSARPSLTSPSGTVRVVGPATVHPAAGTVLALLDRHFTAINDRDYATWSTTVVARRARDQPESRWAADYRSTRDSSVEVTAIDDTGSDAVAVTLSFVSEQDTADAPSDLPAARICWTSQWPVVDLSSGGRLDRPASRTTTRRAC